MFLKEGTKWALQDATAGEFVLVQFLPILQNSY